MEAVAIKTNKIYTAKKVVSTIIIAVLLFMLLPISIAFGAELGGYVSEKVISRSGTNNSQLEIGTGSTSNSQLDIIMSQVEGIPNPNLNPDSGQYQLNVLIPMIFMAMLIFMLLAMIAKGDINAVTIIIASVLIYTAYAFLPSMWEQIVALLGG
jgi:hypothetical protein